MEKQDLDLFLSELKNLINIESPSNNVEGISKVADIFEAKAKTMGLQTKRVVFKDNVGDCLVISNNLEAEQFDVMLSSHMDTVFEIGHIKKAPFNIDGNIVKGPGVIDCKGCALMGMYSLNELDYSGKNIVYLLNSQEEIGSPETGALIKEYAKKSKCCLVLEPGRPNGEYVLSRKGVVRYNVSFKGIAAHSGNNPDKGASAVFEAANFINHSSQINDYDVGHTFNALVTNGGGSALNMIPEYAEVALEMRYVVPESLDFVQNIIQKAIANRLNSKVEIEYKQRDHLYPMFDVTKSKEIKEILDKTGVRLGHQVEWIKAGGGSDGNIASEMGCPTLDGFGMVGGNMHTAQEFGEIDTIIPRTNFLIHSINDLSHYFNSK